MEYAIEIKHLTKDYGSFKLDDVSITVPGGSIMGLIGENGAGKSTTLKCLLGLVRPDCGTIRLLGGDPDRSEVREQVGVVFDENRFHESLTAAQIGRFMPGLYKSWDKALFAQLIQKFDLSPKLTVKEYSRGMRMKLAIAAALAHRPKLLILDEATSGLDPVVREEILDEFLEFIQDEEHAVLISSHITSDLEKAADYITYLHQGKVLIQGEKDALLEYYGRLACSAGEMDAVDKRFLAARRSGQFGAEALIKDRAAFRRSYPELAADPVTLDEIMVFTTRGDAV